MMVEVGCFALCFLISFLLSTQELAHSDFSLHDKFLLYRYNPYFIFYGIGHGLIAIISLYVLEDKGLVAERHELSFVWPAFFVGIGISSVTHLSFFERKTEDGTVSIGINSFRKMLDKFMLGHVVDRHDLVVKDRVKRNLKVTEKLDKETIVHALRENMPFPSKVSDTIKNEAFMSMVPDYSVNSIQEAYIRQYGVIRYQQAIKDLKKKIKRK